MTRSTALSHVRICDFSGQLAGAGATKFLAAFGADVIRIEDPVRRGRWDILRGTPPFADERRGLELSGAFNNHNVEKKGITLNLRTEQGRELLTRLIEISDVVTENFAAGVFDRLGFGYDRLREIRDDIVYVSNCGFGHRGPYSPFKTWGPIVQAVSGLTFTSGLPDREPAGWGFSYMDHTGAYYMAMAILMALHHREVTGEGQWVDLSCTDAGATLNGVAILDYTVNGRRSRRAGQPDSNHGSSPSGAPHGIFPARGDDEWIAIAVVDEAHWKAFSAVVSEPWVTDARFATRDDRLRHEDELDLAVAGWTSARGRLETATRLQAAGVPAAAVQTPPERIDSDSNTAEWGLWPTVRHSEIGEVRVDGLPVHLTRTDWSMEYGAPCLGEHNAEIFGGLLGLSDAEISTLRMEGVI